ncbi:MAG: ribosome maturation factor RimP [Candidatus Omnitrophica bacterium]|nr:ribosome maturation factor RimP [Candidatus Omnitrophota bacterium]
MTPQEQQKIIYKKIDGIAQSLNLELVELKIATHQKDVMIQVLADKPRGGIGIEECTLLNRSIVEAIDKEAFFSEDGYSLEVSSPGLDRPLVTFRDFSRNINLEVRVLLKEKVLGKGEYVGVVKSVTEDVLTLLTTKEQKEINVPINLIQQGLLVI